jgi:hypothetical protein
MEPICARAGGQQHVHGLARPTLVNCFRNPRPDVLPRRIHKRLCFPGDRKAIVVRGAGMRAWVEPLSVPIQYCVASEIDLLRVPFMGSHPSRHNLLVNLFRTSLGRRCARSYALQIYLYYFNSPYPSCRAHFNINTFSTPFKRGSVSDEYRARCWISNLTLAK